jgi:hypothetical protein
MCDYSLHNVASRPARVGDKLVTTKFRGTMTRGFAAVDEPAVAVCLRPGSELAFACDAEYGPALVRWLPFLRRRKSVGKLARFRQVNTSRHDNHHDALEFSDGRTVLLTQLCSGQSATVLQLPVGGRFRNRICGPAAFSAGFLIGCSSDKSRPNDQHRPLSLADSS